MSSRRRVAADRVTVLGYHLVDGIRSEGHGREKVAVSKSGRIGCVTEEEQDAIVGRTFREYQKEVKHLSCLKAKAAEVAESFNEVSKALRSPYSTFDQSKDELRMEQGKLPTKLPDINDARNLLIELPSVKEK